MKYIMVDLVVFYNKKYYMNRRDGLVDIICYLLYKFVVVVNEFDIIFFWCENGFVCLFFVCCLVKQYIKQYKCDEYNENDK